MPAIPAVLREDTDDVAYAFGRLELGPDDVDLIVCADTEEILGVGDWGMGGIQVQDAMWQPVYPAGA